MVALDDDDNDVVDGLLIVELMVATLKNHCNALGLSGCLEG